MQGQLQLKALNFIDVLKPNTQVCLVSLCVHRLEDAVLKVYKDGNSSVLPEDVGGLGTSRSFTDAVIKNALNVPKN